MPPATQTAATLDDLARVEGKAELIAGRIVHLMPSGDAPSEAAFEIAVRLRDHARRREPVGCKESAGNSATSFEM